MDARYITYITGPTIDWTANCRRLFESLHALAINAICGMGHTDSHVIRDATSQAPLITKIDITTCNERTSQHSRYISPLLTDYCNTPHSNAITVCDDRNEGLLCSTWILLQTYPSIWLSSWSGVGVFYPSTQRHYRMLILLYYYTAACFGHTSIFKQKICNSLRITQMITDPLF
jgi:hypothetical protein